MLTVLVTLSSGANVEAILRLLLTVIVEPVVASKVLSDIPEPCNLTEVFELFIVLVMDRLTPSLPVAAEIVLTTIPLLTWRSILVDELKVDLTGKEFTGTVS